MDGIARIVDIMLNIAENIQENQLAIMNYMSRVSDGEEKIILKAQIMRTEELMEQVQDAFREMGVHE